MQKKISRKMISKKTLMDNSPDVLIMHDNQDLNRFMVIFRNSRLIMIKQLNKSMMDF